MEKQNKFRLVLGEGRGTRTIERDRRRLKTGTRERHPTATQLVRALKASPGAGKLIKQIPQLVNPGSWRQVAFFSVCEKSGTASFLDFEGPLLLDRVSTVQQCLQSCSVFYSNVSPLGGFGASGRVVCEFSVPSDGVYACHVRLQSYFEPGEFRCRIDGFQFGDVRFEGVVNQPHTARLTAGRHVFSITHVRGKYFFRSMSVWSVLIVEA